ncbi:MAG: serine/threonine protein kinase [Kofleriaceae bacterium]|nr:serine/threonine protein kinase [Kofleriaceae bacterium]
MSYVVPFHPGHTLGKYEIVRELATGGMARIYLARVRGTAGFEKNVVLKCILPHLAADNAFVTMFLDEARLAATLRHSNIADVIDVGIEDGTYFFAMEYVNGQNARSVRLRAKDTNLPIPLEVAVAIVAGTASALEHAHTRESTHGPLELVHRDVSPSNILVSYEGAIKLVDFGIARATSRVSAKTRPGIRKGKTPYLSPEQCRGHAIDRRSDLFSLGTVLYELATGTRPFRGNSDFEVMEAIVDAKPAPPSTLVPTLPARLDDIVIKLLARAPAVRFQSAAELLEALDDLVASQGLRTTAHVVARYMHDLYDEKPTAPFARAFIEEGPTETFRKPRPGTVLPPRRSKRASTAPVDTFSEPTRPEIVLPFDPIDARSAEILDRLDDGAPANETSEARGARRVLALLDRALAFVQTGELDKAVTAVELLLDEGIETSSTHQLLEDNVDAITGVYEAMLEDPYRTLTLTRPLSELATVAMEPQTRLLLPWIDGRASIIEVLDRAGMQRLEAYHHLCQLLLRGIVR